MKSRNDLRPGSRGAHMTEIRKPWRNYLMIGIALMIGSGLIG
jgi:hypothetical protein